MYDLQLTTNRILKLTQSKKLSVNQMLKNAGLTSSLLDNMKRGRIPSVDKIYIIANYLGCSADYLLGLTDDFTDISDSTSQNLEKKNQSIKDDGEERLLETYRILNESNKIEIQVQARLSLIKQTEREKEKITV